MKSNNLNKKEKIGVITIFIYFLLTTSIFNIIKFLFLFIVTLLLSPLTIINNNWFDKWINLINKTNRKNGNHKR
jgi:hypothetical protein